MPERRAIFPPNRHAGYDEHRYSAAIRSGDLLPVAGQVGSREDGPPEPDYEAQVRLAFRNLSAVLEAAGCTFADIVDVTSFHIDPEKQFGTRSLPSGVKSSRKRLTRTGRRSTSAGSPASMARSRSSHAFRILPRRATGRRAGAVAAAVPPQRATPR